MSIQGETLLFLFQIAFDCVGIAVIHGFARLARRIWERPG
jgi:hypothetical protein